MEEMRLKEEKELFETYLKNIVSNLKEQENILKELESLNITSKKTKGFDLKQNEKSELIPDNRTYYEELSIKKNNVFVLKNQRRSLTEELTEINKEIFKNEM